MKLSFEKLQFWKWKSTLLVPEYFVPRPCWHSIFLIAGNVFRHGGMENTAWARDKMFPHQQGAFPFPELQFSRGKLRCLYFAFSHTR
jgi:hypothetical protein